MSKRSARKARQLARRKDDQIAGALPESEPAIVRQTEMFPAEITFSESTAFSGPLPPPDLLLEYDQVAPGLAERIVLMAEKEGDHRRTMQRGLLRLSWGGLISAFVITMTGIVGGIALIHEGKSTEGLTTMITAMAALVAVYLTRGGRKKSAGSD